MGRPRGVCLGKGEPAQGDCSVFFPAGESFFVWRMPEWSTFSWVFLWNIRGVIAHKQVSSYARTHTTSIVRNRAWGCFVLFS